MWYLFYAYNFILSFALSLALTWGAIAVSRKWGIYDRPGERKVHGRNMPVLGWVGILGGILGAIAVNVLILRWASGNYGYLNVMGRDVINYIPGFYRKFPKLVGITIGGFIVILLGLYDDMRNLSPLKKLAGQVLAALTLVAFDIRITFFIPNYLASTVMTVAWVVLLMNAFNLLDNMDGLSGGVAFIAAVLFFFAVASLRQFFISSMLSILAGAILGFLVFNFNPAKIFMGDAGSMFLGYIIAALTVAATFYQKIVPTHFSVIMPLLILAVPLYDTISVVVIRIKNRKPVYVGDRNHFSHRLTMLGMSHKGAVLFIYLVSFAAGVPALFLPFVGLTGAALILLQTLSIVSIVAFLEYYSRTK